MLTDGRRERAAVVAAASLELRAAIEAGRTAPRALTHLALDLEALFAAPPWPSRFARRNAALVLDRAAGATLAVVGARFGVTRERARAIYRAGLLRWYVARKPERAAEWRALTRPRRKIA